MSSNPRNVRADSISLAAQVSGLTIGSQVQRDSERILVESGVAVPNEVFVAEKKPPCPHGPLMPIFQYDVEFRGIRALGGGGTRVVKFTKRPPDNSPVTLERKDQVRAVLTGLLRRHAGVFNGPVFCDLQGIVYTTIELPLDEFPADTASGLCSDRHGAYVFGGIQHGDITVPFGLFHPNIIRFEVSFKRPQDGFRIDLGDFRRLVTRNPASVDRSLLQFLDIATSNHINMHPDEHVVFPSGESYLMVPPAHGFSSDDMLLRDGRNLLDPSNQVYVAIGMRKSVHLVSGPNGDGGCVIVVDTKKGMFHMPGPLLERVETIVAPAAVDDIAGDARAAYTFTVKLCGKYVHNIVVHPANAHCIRLKHLVRETAQTMLVNFQGRDMSVEEFFRVVYNYTILHPTAPLVQASVRDRIGHYPIEMLELADNQRVRAEEADPLVLRNMTAACAIEPQKLFAQNQLNLDALNLANPDLGALGIRTNGDGPLQITGSIHTPPKLEYANVEVEPREGKWRSAQAKYLKSTGTLKWAAVVVEGHQDRFTADDHRQFLQAFIEMAMQKGMTLGEPLVVRVPVVVRSVKTKMSELAELGVEYVLFAHSNADNFVHDLMKWGETQHGFITQDVRLKTCQDVVRRARTQTLENIVNKANVKLGGLNYTFSRSDPNAAKFLEDVLHIGLGVNHPGRAVGMYPEGVVGDVGRGYGRDGHANANEHRNAVRHSGPPTVVGFSANCRTDPFEFVGDFLFQEAHRDEKVTVISTVIRRCLEQYYCNRTKLPKRVVLFRNGCAEGQFADVLKYEVALAVHEIQEASNRLGCEPPKLTVLVCNKRHNVRFFPGPIPSGRAPEQNVKPGTTIDHTVTSMNQWEFYLSAHTAPQGTAKVPRYTVLYDQNDLSSENLQRLVYWLCHGHQIVALTTSLPAPLYIANEYAKRGRNIYKSVTTVGDDDNHGDAAGAIYKRMTYEELNDALTYWHGRGGLRMRTRVNA